ncbi:MAG: acyl-CoA thioesterase [Oscillospiraceae bacterium]|nr:acyl-CoA thioesterase [Oscillospiraceae bacterium]
MESITNITVRYAETDMMGIVHHSRYYPWFEQARTEFIKSAGMSYSQMEKDGILLPLAETHAKYIIPLKYEDEVRIFTTMTKLGVASCEFGYRVYRGEELCTTGRTVHAITNADFKPFNLKKADRGVWDRLNSLVSDKNRNIRI